MTKHYSLNSLREWNELVNHMNLCRRKIEADFLSMWWQVVGKAWSPLEFLLPYEIYMLTKGKKDEVEMLIQFID